MNVLGGMSIFSNGVRMAKGLLRAAQEHSGKPFELGADQSVGLKLIEQRDKDNDGALSLAELGGSREILERFDSDGDGLLTELEINNGITELGQERQIRHAIAQYMELHDSDLNALVSSAESGLDTDHFELIDVNEDGFLNSGEITSAYRRQRLDLSG